ncbi:hypothetical protein AAEO50_00385 [Rossellomorea oryzaecorticis]|uniref:LAGLIDADG homing endonuclease n=1 Tax=Rossellomorea oryzaecorticis TaxID=1396505 RepID=A0ABU9K3Q7_9BACI
MDGNWEGVNTEAAGGPAKINNIESKGYFLQPNKDLSLNRMSFHLSAENKRCFRAGIYGKKRVNFISQTKEDKYFIELYNFPPQHRTNILTCFIKENERIVYTGKKGLKE